MADFTLFHLLITSSIWHSDDKTLRVWITILALCDNGIARVSVKSLAHSASVSEEQCRAALAVLLAPDADSRGTDHEGRRIERVDGGYRVLNADTYLQILRDAIVRTPSKRNTPHRKEWMRDYMAKRRERQKGGSPPAESQPVQQGFTPPTIEEALAFATRYNGGQGLTRGLQITPEMVHSWWEDRKSVGWTVVKHNTQIPLSDWQSDLPKYAGTWKRNETGGGSRSFGGGAGTKSSSTPGGGLNSPDRYGPRKSHSGGS